MGLKLIFLIVSRVTSLLARLTWPEGAWLALLAGTIPARRLATMRLIATPGTIMR